MKTIVIVNSDSMGQGDSAVGGRILHMFLSKAASLEDLEAIVFYNTAVRLLASASEVLQPLTALDDNGVDLLACGTCVTHFKLDDQLAIGRIGDMDDLLRLMKRAQKVITL